jgi:hypothetical protein
MELAQASAEGVETAFLCPARLAGRPALLAIGQTSGTERVRRPPAPDTPVRLPLPATVASDKPIWIVRGLEADRTETGTIPVPRGARLRVALGLSPALPDEPATPARFRVVGHDAQGRTATVLERRLCPVFDLDREPGERAFAATADLLDRAREARARFEGKCAQQRAQVHAAAAAPPPEPAALPDPDRERRLRAMGYVVC